MLRVNPDFVQFALSRKCVVHKHTYKRFMQMLIEMERRGKLCLTPETKLNNGVCGEN